MVEDVEFPLDFIPTVYVVSLTGGFMARTGFEPGFADPKSDALTTRPPWRDGYGALVVPFC